MIGLIPSVYLFYDLYLQYIFDFTRGWIQSCSEETAVAVMRNLPGRKNKKISGQIKLNVDMSPNLLLRDIFEAQPNNLCSLYILKMNGYAFPFVAKVQPRTHG